jgi:Raf kinase inhibitor-like YbhB/YbcL family protein
VSILLAAAFVLTISAREAVAAEQAGASKPQVATLEVRSNAFAPNGPIPRKYTKEGEDVSPALQWGEPPPGTREFALINDDPDAPRDHPWVHWVAYEIPAEARGLPEGAKTGYTAGTNDFGDPGYGGPMPPAGHGVHHYHFKLYALDAPLGAAPGIKKGELLRLMEGHVLATGEVVGTYERK